MSHCHHARLIVIQIRIRLKSYEMRLAGIGIRGVACAVTIGISALYDPIFDTVECQAVVESRFDQIKEIACRVGNHAEKDSQADWSLSSLQYYQLILSGKSRNCK